MASLKRSNLETTYDGVRRAFEDIQLDLEIMLVVSQLHGPSSQEGNASTLMIDILKEGQMARQQVMQQRRPQMQRQ